MRLAIFDIDGTLTQTNSVDNDCFLPAMAHALGMPEAEIDWTEAPHVTDSGILAWLFARHLHRAPNHTEVERARTELVRLLERELSSDATQFRPTPGAPDVFDRLHAEGWSLAMATGCWSSSARLKLAAARIPVGAVPLICSDDAPMRVTLLERAIKEAATGASNGFDRVVSVGDGLWDIEAAVELGVPFVGIGTGERADRLRAAGATHVLSDLADHATLVRALECSGVPVASKG